MGPSAAPNGALDAVRDPPHRRSATKDLARRRGGHGGPRPSSRGSWGPPPIVVRAVGAPAGHYFGQLKAKLPLFWSSGVPPVVDGWWGPQSSLCGRFVAAPAVVGEFLINLFVKKITNEKIKVQVQGGEGRTAVWGGGGGRMVIAAASTRMGRKTKGLVGEFLIFVF